MNQNDSTNEINVNSIEISDVNTDLNDISMTDNSLNELDIGSLIKNDSVVNLDGNYNMIDSNDMYNNLNKETTIKSDVMKDFNNNLRNDSRPNLFDDAPLTD